MLETSGVVFSLALKKSCAGYGATVHQLLVIAGPYGGSEQPNTCCP